MATATRTKKPAAKTTPRIETKVPIAKEILAFDLETQTLIPPGPRDRETFRRMRYSLAGVVNVRTGEFTAYTEAEAPTLIGRLSKAALVVGHNHAEFDFEVLYRHDPKRRLLKVPTIDFILVVKEALGRFPKLDHVTGPTIGKVKNGAGANAPRLWAEGRMAELKEYLEQDVRLVAEVYLAAERDGHIAVDLDGNRHRVKVPTDPAAW